MCEDVQSHGHLLPESRASILPDPWFVGIQKWPLLELDLGAPACGGLVKELCEVLLSPCGPSSQIRSETRDEFAQHLKRAVGFFKGGPVPRQLSCSGNGRKSLQLLNRKGRPLTVEFEIQCAMWFPRHFPIVMQLECTVDGSGRKDEVQVAALQGRGFVFGQNLSSELARYDGGSQLFRTVLPIPSNDEGRVKVSNELQHLSQKLSVER